MQLLLNLKTRCLRIGAQNETSARTFEAIYGEESRIQEHLLVINSFYSFELGLTVQRLMSRLHLILAEIHPGTQISIAIAASLLQDIYNTIITCNLYTFVYELFFPHTQCVKCVQ